VSSRRVAFKRGARLPVIGLLICSVVQVPLPLPDYHNIRHHDAPGEICQYHHHLLRWHPTAASDADVALLHWHWFLPRSEPAGGPGGASTEGEGPGSGASLHAHIDDLLAPDWEGQPAITNDSHGRFLGRLALELSAASLALLQHRSISPNHQPGVVTAWPRLAGDLLRAERIALLQRWNC
jgi:hypothetical protein